MIDVAERRGLGNLQRALAVGVEREAGLLDARDLALDRHAVLLEALEHLGHLRLGHAATDGVEVGVAAVIFVLPGLDGEAALPRGGPVAQVRDVDVGDRVGHVGLLAATHLARLGDVLALLVEHVAVLRARHLAARLAALGVAHLLLLVLGGHGVVAAARARDKLDGLRAGLERRAADVVLAVDPAGTLVGDETRILDPAPLHLAAQRDRVRAGRNRSRRGPERLSWSSPT